jgi:methyl-accepting chemotaxis protein
MKNLSLGSRLHYLIGLAMGLFLIFGYLAAGGGRLTAWAWTAFAATTLLLALALYSIYRVQKAIAGLTTLVQEAARGNLDSRVTGIKTGAATGELAWAINDLLDQQEAYFREVLSAFDHATRGQTFRLALDQGLHGSFKDAMVRVNVSVESLGQVQQMALKEKLISRITDLNSGNLIANLKSIQEYLMDMTQELSVVGQISKETARDAEGSRATIEDLVANLNQVAEMIARTNAQTTLLHEKGEEINQIVQVITDVADRTNLLALNAAIEAAHAGEIGKGFAVVAEEVRTLSENTKDAAASIAATIESFGEATSRMIKDSEQVKDIAEGSRNAVTEFRAQVLKFADSAKTSLTQINKAQDFSFASLVKVDHFLFKQAPTPPSPAPSRPITGVAAWAPGTTRARVPTCSPTSRPSTGSKIPMPGSTSTSRRPSACWGVGGRRIPRPRTASSATTKPPSGPAKRWSRCLTAWWRNGTAPCDHFTAVWRATIPPVRFVQRTSRKPAVSSSAARVA